MFGELPPNDLDQLAASARRHTARQGELLFHQGSVADAFVFILSGRLRLVQHSMDGKDVTLSTFVPGDVVGLVVALLGDTYPGSAETLENVEVLIIPGTIVWQLMNDHGAFSIRVVRILSTRLQEAQNRIRELSTERVQQRIARSLLRLAQKVGVKEEKGSIRLDMRLSRQDLAQLNGTTLETVSRTLTTWEADGIVEAGREQIVILRPHTLVTIAEDLPR